MSEKTIRSTDEISADLVRHYKLTLGRDEISSGHRYLFKALALAVRERLVERWSATRARYREQQVKRINYLSLEFLMGRALTNAVINLDIEEPVRRALAEHGCTLEEIAEEEHDAGLGNGGLGRLAACFLDSCATLSLPVTGYGIYYEYGMFHQQLENGYQVECPDSWLRDGHPWEIEAPDCTRRVQYGGYTEKVSNADGSFTMCWRDTRDVLAVPYDLPIPGYRNDTVNTLRLWKAAATDEFNLEEFNAGGYTEAVAEKNKAERISMVLYPNDASENGKELRLRQQYFLASASLQDVIARWQHTHGNDFSGFAEKNGFQLNDTHPTIAIAELMRLLIDVHGVAWDEAWAITTGCMAYTNHTLLPEALERWSVRMLSALLPRLMEIILEINARFLGQLESRFAGDVDRLRRMSIIEEGDEPQVRMAYLAIVGSHSINGVAALHTELLKQGLFADFFALWPERFNNKTNGVTPRRWLAHCNPQLAALITGTIGDGWQTDLERLQEMKTRIADRQFRSQWHQIKQANKQRLAALVQSETGVVFDTSMMFDVQVKRFHEYKRQLLNVLHVIHLYDRINRGDTKGLQPRCVLIGGKAAPGYAIAKLIIKLVTSVADVVNNDERCAPWLRVAFLPNYRVTSMEVICPGTDLSEQISTAGKEASGTGNMKFMMNGAITVGTYDGANIEILEAVGGDNFFLFGLRTAEIEQQRSSYDPERIIAADEDLNRVMKLLEQGVCAGNDSKLFAPIIAAIRSQTDPWMVAADFRTYVDAQREVDSAYADRERWLRMSILNCAMSGRFSSDRTIRQYADEIWGL